MSLSTTIAAEPGQQQSAVLVRMFGSVPAAMLRSSDISDRQIVFGATGAAMWAILQKHARNAAVRILQRSELGRRRSRVAYRHSFHRSGSYGSMPTPESQHDVMIRCSLRPYSLGPRASSQSTQIGSGHAFLRSSRMIPLSRATTVTKHSTAASDYFRNDRVKP